MNPKLFVSLYKSLQEWSKENDNEELEPTEHAVLCTANFRMATAAAKEFDEITEVTKKVYDSK